MRCWTTSRGSHAWRDGPVGRTPSSVRFQLESARTWASKLRFPSATKRRSRSSDMPPAERGAEENQAEAQECEASTTEERCRRGDGQLE